MLASSHPRYVRNRYVTPLTTIAPQPLPGYVCHIRRQRALGHQASHWTGALPGSGPEGLQPTPTPLSSTPPPLFVCVPTHPPTHPPPASTCLPTQISDTLPLWGYRRKSYLIAAGLAGAVGWLLLALPAAWGGAGSMAGVLGLIVAVSGASAVSDVVVDSMVVERARREAQVRAWWRLAGGGGGGGTCAYSSSGLRCMGV